MTTPWLTVVGIGADGLTSLSPVARDLVVNAQVLVGGARHLEMVTPFTTERILIRAPLSDVMAEIARHRGRRVVVLASGDPLHYGIAVTLLEHFDSSEIRVLPNLSSITLAAARLNWPRQPLTVFTVHGRPLETLYRYIHPGARLLILAHDGDTPARIAALLTLQGFGPSRVVALENLGGSDERLHEATAAAWVHPRSEDLVIVAVECRPGPQASSFSAAPGLPDEAFEHDGQITKREVRAVTMAALAPKPGQRLWDVGAGAGSIAIEWLRAAPGMAATAIERDPARADRIARNAATLGVPELAIVRGEAIETLHSLPIPDAIFIGGGVANPGLLDACWDALPLGGRLVANAVTVESEAVLAKHHHDHGGTLTRIAISRAEPMGGKSGAPGGWRALAPVTQLCTVKT
jgi:precorrin-6B C5,15-methyltransferase / cobalt-precorrin-6B C5,C15-methyltransferase